MSQKFLLPNGDVAEATTEDSRQALLAAGAFAATDADLHLEDLKKQYSSLAYAPAAAALGAVQGALPGATGAVLGGVGMVSPDSAHELGDFINGVSAAHPMAKTIGTIAGAVGTGGAGAATKLGIVGAGAVMGAAVVSDQLALQHIQTPEGGENVMAQLGVGALFGVAAAVLGAGVANVVLSKGISRAGVAIEEKGEQLLVNKAIPKPGQAKLVQSGALDDAKNYLSTNDMLTKSPQEIKTFLADRARVTDSVIKEARAATATERLDMQTQMQLASSLRQQLAGTPVLPKAMKAFDEPWGLEQLHNLRMNIDKAINWAEPSSQYTQQLMGARDTVSSQIKDLFAGWASNPAMAEQAQRWEAANAEFSTIMKLSGALRMKGAGGPGLLSALAKGADKLGNAAIGGSLLSMGPGAVPGFALKAGAAGLRAVDNGAGGQVLVGLGKALQSFDDNIVQVVADGLVGGAPVAAQRAAGQVAVTLAKYEDVAALVGLSAMHPADVIPRMAQHLESQGVPGEVADAAIPQAMKSLAYISSVAPQNPFRGQTVAPVAWKPPTRDKVEFLEKVNAINNPQWALANPTPTRIAALKAVYPLMMERVSQMIVEHAATRPAMHPAARRWASAVTGVPASPLAMPAMQSALAFGDQMLAQQRQKQAAQMQKGGSSSSVMTGGSRLDRMSGF